MEGNKKSKKKIIIITLATLAIVITVCSIFFIVQNILADREDNVSKSIVKNTKVEFVGDKAEKLAMEKIEEEIKQKLKNPNSLLINNVKVTYMHEEDDGHYELYYTQEALKKALQNSKINDKYKILYEIDYSAENSFGGMTRSNLKASIQLYNRERGITYSITSLEFER